MNWSSFATENQRLTNQDLTKEENPVLVSTFDEKYKFVEMLGKGGMGEIYRALDPNLGRNVAIKVLRGKAATDTTQIMRLRQEAMVGCRVNHPALVPVYVCAVSCDGSPYIVMELLEGLSLSQLLKQEQRLPWERAVQISCQIASGMAAAHGAQVLHRDLKPSNIFVQKIDDQSDLIRILDFGIARFTCGSAEQSLTRDGALIGTPSYMSPEQCQGNAITAQSDIYSLGVVLYEMLSGCTPFTGESPLSIIMAQVNEQAPPLDDVYMPPDLQRVLAKCLAKNPAERYASMDNLHEDLNRVLQGQTLQFATSTASATKEPTMGAFTVPIGIALLTLCCVGGLIVSAASLAEGVITVSDIVQSSSSNRVNLYLAGASICVKLPGKRGASEFIRAAEISAATCGELERYEVAKEGADLKLSADESQEYSKKTITALYSWIHKAPQVVHALIPPEQLVKVIDQYGVRRDDSVSMPPVVGAIATYSVECSPEESVALYTWLTNRYARASVSVNPVLKTQMEISLAAALTRVNRNTEAIEHLQRILYVVDALPSALPSTEAIERDSAATYVNATLPVNDPRLLAAAKRLQDVVLKYPDLLKSAPNTFRWYVIRPAQALMKRGRSEDARMLIVRFLDKVRAGRFAHDADVYENGKFAYELLEEIEAVQEREGLIRKNDLADAKNWLESINPSQHK